jgi:hypothetical protein
MQRLSGNAPLASSAADGGNWLLVICGGSAGAPSSALSKLSNHVPALSRIRQLVTPAMRRSVGSSLDTWVGLTYVWVGLTYTWVGLTYVWVGLTSPG